jgi:succinate dehydrogenase / fumarate reductase cytochrome b subunit
VHTTTLKIHQTTVGKKAIMALSGIALFGFVLVHFAGNLTLYAGPEAMYNYAKGLRTVPALLWVARLGLLAAAVAHIVTSFQLTQRNKAARPQRYHQQKDLATNYAAKTMILSGPILAFYLLFHLAHLTFGVAPGYEHDPYNVYNNVVQSFSIPWISAIYIAGNLCLGVHLFHGVWSLFQSLGLNHPRYNPLRRHAASAFAALITVGNVGFPVAVMLGLVQKTSMTFPPF